MPLHDFTLDVKDDPGNDLIITTNKIDVSAMRRNLSTKEYFDDGVGHYSDFEHTFDALVASVGTDNSGYNAVWMLANAIGDSASLETADDHHIKIWLTGQPSGVGIQLVEWYNGSRFQDSQIPLGNKDTRFYFTVKYVSATKVLTCKTYNDSGRNNLIDTRTITLQVDDTWRYRYSTASRNTGSSLRWTGDVQNLDLQEAVSGGSRRKKIVNQQLKRAA